MDKNIGLCCALASAAIWLAIMLLVVVRLPVKIDTFLMLSWPVLPGVVGGLLFQKKDREGSWD